jgi:ribosome-associated protein
MPDPQTPSPSPPSGRVRLAPGVWADPGVLRTRAVSSSGPGGQNVNRRATKVELRVALADLPLTARQRARLRRLAGSRVTDAGELVLASDEHRSQRRNREACHARLSELILQSLAEPKRRIATRPSRGARERRLESKRQRAEKLRRRRPPDQD